MKKDNKIKCGYAFTNLLLFMILLLFMFYKTGYASSDNKPNIILITADEEYL